MGTHGLDVSSRTTNQKIFAESLCCYLVNAAKHAGDYRLDEILYE